MVTVEFMKTDMRAKIPTFANKSDAGMDFYSKETISIPSGERVLVGTGVAMQFKFSLIEKVKRKLFGSKFELQGRCKSGRALKEGFMLTNGVGTIDEDYRGEIGCIITNSGSGTIYIKTWQKLFQGVVNELPNVSITEVDYLDNTSRGDGGYGSTGLN